MKFKKTALGVLSLGWLLVACNSVDFKKTKGGVPYKIIEGKGGENYKTGNFAKFQMTIRIGDSVRFNSYDAMPQYQPIDSLPQGPDPSDLSYILSEVLPKLKSTDSVIISMTTDSLLKHNPQIAMQDASIKKGQKFVTTLRMVGLFKNAEEAQKDAMTEQKAAQVKMEAASLKKFKADAKGQQQLAADNKEIEAYLAGKNIKTTKSPWGVYIQSLAPGNGVKAKAGQFISVRYKGTNLAGEEFDSNTGGGKPVLPVQIGAGGIIKGFEDGLAQLSKGEKAILYIPSIIAYGQQGSPPKIGPNQNLVFEVEVVDISDTAPAQPQMPQQPIDTTMPKR